MSTKWWRTGLAAALIGIALWTYLTYGFNESVSRDSGLYAFAGQCVADGQAPYKAVFDVKGPFSSMVPALGVLGARYAGVPDYLGIQVEFLIITVLLVVVTYLLTAAVTGSLTAGFLAGLAFMGFGGMVKTAAGCEPKVAALLFMVLALLFVVRKRWLAAGAMVACSALVWQAMVVVGIACLVATASEERHLRVRAGAKLVAGGLIVLAAVVVWFVAEGAVMDLWEGSVVALFSGAGRVWEDPLSWRLWRPLRIWSRWAPDTLLTGTLGTVGMLAALVGAYRKHGGVVPMLEKSRYTAVGLSFLFLGGFTVLDMQGLADLKVMVPFTSLGMGFLLIQAVNGLTGPEGSLAKRHRAVMGVGIAVALLLPVAVRVKFEPGHGLQTQKEAVAEIVEELDGEPIQCINAPEVLLLGELPSPTRHVVITDPIVGFMRKHRSNGLESWLRRIEQADVKLVVRDKNDPEQLPAVRAWVDANCSLWRAYEDWDVYRLQQQDGAAAAALDEPMDTPDD
jgi:hypothetical protein